MSGLARDAAPGAPSPVLPADVASLRDLVRACTGGLVVTGGRKAPAPLEGDAGRTLVSLADQRRILAHDPGDLVVTVEPGLLLDDLADALARCGQRTAIEAPRGRGFTVGGTLALGREGFLAAAFGPMRDQLLGAAFVDGRGELLRSGGRVVKNVTGYDLGRLQVGAAGQFGVLVEATLRLRPLPAASATWRLERPTAEEALRLGLGLRDLDQRVSGLAVAGGAASPEAPGSWTVSVRIEGGRAALAEAGARLADLGADSERLEGGAEGEHWDRVQAWPEGKPLRLALALRPSLVGTAIARCAESAGPGRGFVADLACGRLEVAETSETAALDPWLESLGAAALARDLGAVASTPGAPDDRPGRRRRFGAPTDAVARLQERLKDAFDPERILGAGRWWREPSS